MGVLDETNAVFGLLTQGPSCSPWIKESFPLSSLSVIKYIL